MLTSLLVSNIALWTTVLLLGFLLLGALRAFARLTWRLDQWEAIHPRRPDREGLEVGRPAPDFALPAPNGGEVKLRDFAGRKVLLVFTQSGCGPCAGIVPELNRLQRRGLAQILVVNSGDPADTRRWAVQTGAAFPVLSQDQWRVSKLYRVYATPFAFAIDERGVIRAKGIASNRQYLAFVLAAAGADTQGDDAEERVGVPEPEVTRV